MECDLLHDSTSRPSIAKFRKVVLLLAKMHTNQLKGETPGILSTSDEEALLPPMDSYVVAQEFSETAGESHVLGRLITSDAAVDWANANEIESQWSENAQDASKDGATEFLAIESIFDVAGPSEVEKACCSKSLACMNTNSNGKASADIVNLPKTDTTSMAKETRECSPASPRSHNVPKDSRINKVNRSSGLDSISGRSKSLRRVKTINMGEIPLRPVGLSLSGSGMELYVKVDSSKHMEHLVDLESRIVAQVSKARKPPRKSTRGKAEGLATLETPVAMRLRGQTDVDLNDAVFVRPANPLSQSKAATATSNLKESLKTQSHKESEMGTVDHILSNSDVYIKEEVLDNVDGEQSPNIATDTQANNAGSNYATVSNDVETNNILFHDPPRQQQQNKLQSHHWSGVRAMDRSTWRRPHSRRTQGVQATASDDVHIDASDAAGSGVKNKRPAPSLFTSSDLPLKKPSVAVSRPDGDTLIQQQRNNSSFFNPLPPGRASALCSNTNNASCSLSASDQTERGVEGCNYSTYRLADTDSLELNRCHAREPGDPFPSAPDRVSLTTQAESHPGASDGQTRAREADNMTPLSCVSFDVAQLQGRSSGAIDAATLARFAHYTSSMRRDLKQSYKKLSVLMKEFSGEVAEHYRNQTASDSTNATMDDMPEESASDSLDSRNDADVSGKRRCAIM